MIALVAAAVAVSACSVSVGGKKYDATKIEAFLVTGQEGKVGGLSLGAATCPDKVEITEGVTFQCTVDIGGTAAPFKVTLTDVDKDKAHIEVAPAKAIISVAAAEAFVTKNLNDSATGATVDCSAGGKKVILADPGDKVTCSLTLGDQSDTVDLEVKDTKGNIVISG